MGSPVAESTANTKTSVYVRTALDLGVTFLPEMAVGSALLQGTQVRTYELGDKSYRTIALAWRRGSPRAAEFRMLGKFVAEHRDG